MLRPINNTAPAAGTLSFLTTTASVGIVYALITIVWSSVALARDTPSVHGTVIALLLGLIMLFASTGFIVALQTLALIMPAAIFFSIVTLINVLSLGDFTVTGSLAPSLFFSCFIAFEIMKCATVIISHNIEAPTFLTPPIAPAKYLLATLGIHPICYWLTFPSNITSSVLFLIARTAYAASIIVIIIMLSPGYIENAKRLITNRCIDDSSSGCILMYIFISTAFSICAWSILWIFAGITLYLARRTSCVQAQKLIDLDTRNPILFLRSFTDDQVKLPGGKLPILSRLVAGGDRFSLFDHILLEEGTSAGPVVAIGDPHSKPPFGASRTYPSNEEWKHVIADFAEKATLIAIAVDHTPGVAWELEHLLSRPALRTKTIFLLPPRLARIDHAREFILSHSKQHLNQEEQNKLFELFDRYRGWCVGWTFPTSSSIEVLTVNTAPFRDCYAIGLRYMIKRLEGSIQVPARFSVFEAFVALLSMGWASRIFRPHVKKLTYYALLLSMILLTLGSLSGRLPRVQTITGSDSSTDTGLSGRLLLLHSPSVPTPGDIAFYKTDRQEFMRRLIAGPSDIIAVLDNKIMINETPLRLDFLSLGTKIEPERVVKMVLPKDTFVFGSGAIRANSFTLVEVKNPLSVRSAKIIVRKSDIDGTLRYEMFAGLILVLFVIGGPLIVERYLSVSTESGYRWPKRIYYSWWCLAAIAATSMGDYWGFGPWRYVQVWFFAIYARFGSIIGLM